LRARYRAVLLDEFQDTDRLQWEIFRRAFTEHSGPIVYLIGDPKQSIYRFRGADVDVYVQARATAPAERQTTMAVNHRSDGPYVEALNALFDGEPDAFGASGVHYVPVRAAARHATPRIEGHGPAALSLRWLDGDGLEGLGAGQPLDRALSEVAARDIVALVSSGARLRRGLEVEPLRYRDIAVIVRTNAQGLLVRDALTQKGVSALMQERGNVLAGPEGELCAVVLGAIAEPGDERRCLGLAVAPGFEPPGLGSSGKAALLAGDGAGDGWSEFRRAIYGWSATYERMGCFAALFQALTEGNVWNLLAAGRGGGDRVDGMRQVVEILNEAAHGRSLGPSELLQWVLREQEADDESYRRRASSDTESVRIATIHASKGLEYPFVFLPFAGLPAAMQKGRERPLTHDADGNLELFLGDLASDEGKRRLVASQRESAADGMRQLYVALTRAQHAARVYLPFVDPKSRVEKAVEAYASSSLGALLHGVDREESVDGAPSRMEVARARLTDGGFARARKDVEALCRRCGVEGAIAAEAWHAHPDEVLHGTAAVAPGTEPFACSELAARPVPAGRFSVTWRRVSYTSITSVGGSEEPLRGMDEGATDAALPTGEDGADDRAPPRRSERVPLADVRGGAGFGLFVHTLLEHVDFGTLRPRTTATPDVAPPLSEVARGFAERHGVDDERVCARTVEALASWVRAPLGGTLGERSLSTFEPRDRLDELRFDLSVAGDGPPIEFRALADAMSIGAADDSYPFGAATDGAAYISRLRQLSQERFRGFLTGAIDLVLRVRTPETSRFVLIDYKTNRLLDARGECTWAAYDGASLGRAMIHHDYVLQYHLYLVALHRYLGARMPHYAYEEHIEGVRYLFVRGLGGPAAAGSLHGVFIDRPPEARIRALDALLGGGAPARRPPSVTGGTP
jgi:exodeoxyribonuclease V beta subunit